LDIERVSANYGLPNGYIYDIKEDRFGFLWFGVNEGLFRYDGYEFKAYRHDVRDSTTLSSTNIQAICESRNGEIWLGTGHGLNLLDRRTGKVQRFFPAPRNETTTKIFNFIRSVFEDSRGNLWLASHSSKNFFRFDKTSKRFISTKQQGKPTARHYIRAFLEDRSGKVWASTSYGLLRLNEGDSTFQHILPHPDTASNFNKLINGICEAPDGSFWLATAAGLVNWNPATNAINTGFLPKDLEDSPLDYLMLDRRGNPWFALAKNGLGVYDIKQKKFSHFKYRPNWINSLNNNVVTCLYEDRFMNIWVGTNNGFSKISLDNSGFDWHLNEGSDGNLSNNIFNVFRDSKGTIWTKTPEGFFTMEKGSYEGKKIEGVPQPPLGIGYDNFLEDHEGGIWLTISGDGIYRRAPNEKIFRKIPMRDTLSKVSIIKMSVDNKDGNIFWLGTNDGLCRLNWKTKEQAWYKPLDDLAEIANNRIIIYKQFGDHEIWVYYTISNSLGRFDKRTKKFELFLPSPEDGAVLEGIVKDMEIGKDGNIWIPTSFGLTNFNIHTKKFAMFGKREGLLENELQSVVVDKKEQVWVSGNRFFARFDPVSRTFQNYLISKKILQFHPKSKHLSEDGTICFGSLNGVISFHPDHIRKHRLPPTVVLTDFKVKTESYLLDEPFEATKEILLSHHENDITFEFSGIHYINPLANEYKCRLVGFDNNWRQLGNEHKVSYTNLDPGEYTFQAIAANSDGVWGEAGLSIRLTITPPFWQTLWFKSLIALMMVSIGYAIFKNRQNQLALKRQKEIAEQSAEYKTRFLADVSHEIRTPMNAVIGLSRLALDTPLNDKQTKFIRAIQQSSQNLLTIINDLLDHTKLESGKFAFVRKPFDLALLVDQLNDTLHFQAAEKGLAFLVKTSPALPTHLLGDPLRLNQILTNLLGNAIRFTEAGKVWLDIQQTQEQGSSVKFRFEVGDTGIGIAKDQLEHIFERFNQAHPDVAVTQEGTGLGLSIARQLVERQGGQLFIESEPGKGTRLWFELDFEKSQPNAENEATAAPLQLPSGLKILVVEDNHFNQMLLVEILEKYVSGVETTLAENGKIALEILRSRQFDLVIMDVKMPVMDGYTAAKSIRILENGQAGIPILAVTANAMPEQLQKCREAGMNDHVTKPIEVSELLEKIFRLTQRGPQIDRQKLKAIMANEEKMVDKFLGIFKAQIPELLAQLEASLGTGNWEQASIAAHTIKSHCGFLGLEKQVAMAFEIEQLAEAGNPPEALSVMVENLKKALMGVIEQELG
jgi:signal transduction histidine kinase/CheY-like chemotaxis protein/ligand-binding sensor domain-containing protein/HPt (histidine-containing phosphotransfer) domain-containing protein